MDSSEKRRGRPDARRLLTPSLALMQGRGSQLWPTDIQFY